MASAAGCILAAALSCVALLAGCASPPTASAPQAAAPDDGITYTITRANVTRFAVDWQGHLGSGLCGGCLPLPVSEPNQASMRFVLPGTVLWHLNATLAWSADGLTPSTPVAPDAGGTVTFSVYASAACNPKCPGLRLLDSVSGPSPLTLAFHDKALLPEETGLVLAVRVDSGSAPSPGTVSYHALGGVVSLRAEQGQGGGETQPEKGGPQARLL